MNEVVIKKGFELELDNYAPQIQAALPPHIPVDRFKRTVITSLNQNPDLHAADRRSLFLACVRAAQDGLLPDGREAALVVFKTKDNRTNEYKKVVQYLPMVGGLIKRMRNSGEVSAVDTAVVYENDVFEYERGDNPFIKHKPNLASPGKPFAIYAIIKLTNGEILREVMSVADVEEVRATSRSKDSGPWRDWWAEMARKTALRRCSKRAPSSADLEQIMPDRDDDPVELQAIAAPARPTRQDFAQVEHQPDPAPEETLDQDMDRHIEAESLPGFAPYASWSEWVPAVNEKLYDMKTMSEMDGALATIEPLRAQLKEADEKLWARQNDAIETFRAQLLKGAKPKK